ncbi:MAG: omega-amidase [Lysobacterales bacterium]|jgi:omega-amidase
MDELKLTLVQSRLHWCKPSDNRAHLESLIEKIADSDIVIFPETFTTGFLGESPEQAEGMSGETVNWMKGLSAEHDCVITGSAVIDDGGLKNRLLWVEPDGTVQFYDKHHLLTLAGEDQRYDAGKERKVFEYRGWRICPQICYDLRFPVWCRNRNDYDLLLVVANWPGSRIDAWSTLLKARAIENQCFVAAVNRVGKDGNDFEYPGASVVHDPLGETILKLGEDEQCMQATINLSKVQSVRDSLPFHREADDFSLVSK